MLWEPVKVAQTFWTHLWSSQHSAAYSGLYVNQQGCARFKVVRGASNSSINGSCIPKFEHTTSGITEFMEPFEGPWEKNQKRCLNVTVGFGSLSTKRFLQRISRDTCGKPIRSYLSLCSPFLIRLLHRGCGTKPALLQPVLTLFKPCGIMGKGKFRSKQGFLCSDLPMKNQKLVYLQF